MAQPIIRVDHVTKEFRLGQLTGLGQSLRNGANRLLGRPVARPEAFKALDDVSFSIEAGEVVGIIGHNGAGKSTMLKLLASISQPTQGSVRVDGRVAPLIEVGAGLVTDMTGRENVFLNGAILGMRHDEIRRKFDDIVGFAELERFIDTPVKRYSSGMQVRLGFAIATAVDAGILIVDEVLAVGDLAFQRKCYDRIEGFVRDGNRTLLLVSHNLRQVERLCSRVLMLDRGRLEGDGKPKELCDAFVNRSNAKIASNRGTAAARYETSGEVSLVSARVVPADGDTSPATADHLRLEVVVDVLAPLQNVAFTLGVHTTDLFFISISSSELALPVPQLQPGRHVLACALGGMALTPGIYALHFAVEAGARAVAPIFRADNVATFQVQAPAGYLAPASERFGAVRSSATWDLQPAELAVEGG
jgi:ABC-type polysaccharide/polyol phosphate transport system ATPase subunit